MTKRNCPSIVDYASANSFLGTRDHATLYYATSIWRDGERIKIRYHATDIVTYHPDGVIECNTGGYNTVTTRDRLNRHTCASVRSCKGNVIVNGVRIPYSYFALDARGKLTCEEWSWS